MILKKAFNTLEVKRPELKKMTLVTFFFMNYILNLDMAG